MAKDDAAVGNSAAELEEIVRDCKKKPHNFALLKAKEGVVLKAHPLKSSEVMFRAAKEAGGIPAICMLGTMIAVGKTLEMTLASDEYPASLPKLAKKHFTELKMPLKIVVILPNGQRIEAGDDDDGTTAGVGEEIAVAQMVSDAAAQQEDPDAARKAALTNRIKAAVPRLREAAGQGLAGIDKLTKAIQAAATEMANNGLDRAEKLVEAVEAGLRLVAGGKGGGVEDEAGLRQQLVQEFSGMAGDLRALLQGAEKAVAGKATQLIGMFKSEIDKDLKKSGQILSLLRAMTTSAAQKPPVSPDATPSGDTSAPPGSDDRGGDGGGKEGDSNPFAWIAEKVSSVFSGGDEITEPQKEEVGIVEAVVSLVDRIGKAVSDGLDRAAEIVKDNAKLLAIAGDYPEAALAAKEALTAFDEILGGDVEITPTLLAKATGNSDQARKVVAEAEAALQEADEKWFGRAEAVKKAKKDLAEAQAALKTAETYEKAAKGKKLVNETITTGLLSPDAPKSFSGGAALELIKGASRDPDLTASALETARTGQHHETVALNLGKVIDLKQGKFAFGEDKMNEKFSAEYAEKLIRMGGTAGPEYFARMGDYMASGRQFVKDPTGEGDANSFAELEQKRSMSVGKALVKGDGSVDVTSDAARNGIGDALFNPSVMRNPRPAMSAHLLKTVDFLKDPGNATKAGDILKGVSEPTSPGAKSLLRRATGKGGTAPVGKEDVRNSVMASMLKPLDQGPVGSCFATAPARRLRETDPLAAMGSYAQIAGTGKFKPPFGPEVPAVTNTAPGEDPVMRSFEYSLATSTAQRGGSSTGKRLAAANDKGLESLNNVIKAKNLSGIGGLSPIDQETKRQDEDTKATLRLSKLKGDVAQAFTFVYDPMDEIGVSNDGSSDRGRYILKQVSPEKEIRKKEDFIAAMTTTALASLGIDKDAPEATAVIDHVKSGAFLDAVTKAFGDDKKSEYLPWSLSGGGQTTEATQTMFGDVLTQNQMAPISGKPLPDESTRTKDLLKGFMTAMNGKVDDMVTVRTVGMHGFNALPNDPSLAKLKGDTQLERDQAMEDNLLKPGRDLKDRKIPADKALQMFMAEMMPRFENAAPPDVQVAYAEGIKLHSPAADMTPAELTAAVKEASKAANMLRGESAALDWKKKETDKGVMVIEEEFRKKKLEVAAAYEAALTETLTSRMITDLGAPEFVIADTNWGSGANHTFFVICPDPNTGEPLLWEKIVPPGTMSKANRDWIDAEWAKID